MEQLLKTVFYEKHVNLGAKMVEFGGWDMPVQYKTGIVQEHLNTRKQAGLFDVSHMGRFIIGGPAALDFLQHGLSNNAAALEIEESQYTMIPDQNGGAIDDAYLYRFWEDEYLLVVNASNREKDWQHLNGFREKFGRLQLEDRTRQLCMLSLQGPKSKEILAGLLETGNLPEPLRNSLSTVQIGGSRVLVARTGYTGEPICFELFVDRQDALKIWDLLVQQGAMLAGATGGDAGGAGSTRYLAAGGRLAALRPRIGVGSGRQPHTDFCLQSGSICRQFFTAQGRFRR